MELIDNPHQLWVVMSWWRNYFLLFFVVKKRFWWWTQFVVMTFQLIIHSSPPFLWMKRSLSTNFSTHGWPKFLRLNSHLNSYLHIDLTDHFFFHRTKSNKEMRYSSPLSNPKPTITIQPPSSHHLYWITKISVPYLNQYWCSSRPLR